MYKLSFEKLKARREATMTKEEFNSQQELEALEEQLNPKKVSTFGEAIKTSTRYFEPGVEDKNYDR